MLQNLLIRLALHYTATISGPVFAPYEGFLGAPESDRPRWAARKTKFLLVRPGVSLTFETVAELERRSSDQPWSIAALRGVPPFSPVLVHSLNGAQVIAVDLDQVAVGQVAALFKRMALSTVV